MSISRLGKEFFRVIEKRIGPFDRPFQFHVFPFDAGGSLNFLTVGAKQTPRFVTYVSWDLLGHKEQKRGRLGRYELLITCDDEQWSVEVLTKIGRQGLQEVFESGDTLDIGEWVGASAPVQGIVFEEAFSTKLRWLLQTEQCGLLRCVGVTRSELEFAMKFGASALIERLKRDGIYPRTMTQRKESVDLAP